LTQQLNRNGGLENEIEAFRRIYDCDITMFGNSFFHPGQYIFVNPSAIGFNLPKPGNISYQLGLGGYFLITKVDSSIEPGKYETKLQCRWVAFGTSKNKGNVSSNIVPDCEKALGASKGFTKEAVIKKQMDAAKSTMLPMQQSGRPLSYEVFKKLERKKYSWVRWKFTKESSIKKAYKRYRDKFNVKPKKDTRVTTLLD